MNIAMYIEANVFPIAALLVIMNNLKRDMSFSWRRHCLEVIMKLTICIMIFNVVGWCLNGVEGQLANMVLWIADTAYYVFMLYMSFLWFLYVYDKVKSENKIFKLFSGGSTASNACSMQWYKNGQMGASLIPKAVPMIVCLVMLAAGIVKPLIFYIDGENFYHRGPLHFVSTIVGSGYIFVACVMALVGMVRAVEREMRVQYGLLVLFGVFPLIGGVIQSIVYGLDLLWPLTAAALVMVYINIQQQNVSRDGMTGLNNRRRLDQYVDALSREHLGRESLCYSIMDIDYFKEINDSLGHQTGDKVLCSVADALKKVYGNTRSFIARYGGDEFVIISRGFDREQARHYRIKLERMIGSIECDGLEGRALTVSMGSAFYGENGISCVRDMMELADERMYEVKKEHHREAALSSNTL